MKTIKRFLCILIGCGMLVACNDKRSEPDNPSETLSHRIAGTSDWNSQFRPQGATFKYDNAGRMVKIVCQQAESNVIYEPYEYGGETFDMRIDPFWENSFWIFKLNDRGYAVKAIKLEKTETWGLRTQVYRNYEYNENDQLAKITCPMGNWSLTFTYRDEDVVRIEGKISRESTTLVIEPFYENLITHATMENKARLMLPEWMFETGEASDKYSFAGSHECGMLGLLGKGPRHLPIGNMMTDFDKRCWNSDFEWKLDKDGYPVEFTTVLSSKLHKNYLRWETF